MLIDEEPLDKLLNRAPARLAARLLHPTPVTPNQVSAFAGFLGLAAGVAIAIGTPAARLAAAGLLWGHLIFDCADGELARRRGGGSRSGAVVDGLADGLVIISMHVGLLVLALRTAAWPAWVAACVLAVAGISMLVHAGLFDASKQRFRATLGRAPAWSETPEQLRDEIARADTPSERRVLRLYAAYAGSQRLWGRWLAGREGISQLEFLAWTLLGPTTRTTILAAAVAVSIREPLALLAYPAFGLVFGNVWMAALLVVRRIRPRLPSREHGTESARP